MIHLCHISTKQKDQQQPVSVAFCSTAPFMCRHFFPRRCLVDQGCTALLGAPLKSFAFLYLMCLRCSIHFCCTDQRPAGNSSKGIIQKKERRDEDQDVGDVAPNKLDGYPILVERTNKGKADTTSVKSGEKTQDCEKKKKKKKDST